MPSGDIEQIPVSRFTIVFIVVFVPGGFDFFSSQRFLRFPQGPNHWGVGGDRNLLCSGQLQEDLPLLCRCVSFPVGIVCVHFSSLHVGSY